MICPSCQAENIEGADECANCGQSLYGLDLPGGPKSRPLPDFVLRPLGELPQRPPVTVGLNDPVGLAVRRMQDGNTSYVLVLDEQQKLRGIITGWDILHKVAGPNEDLNAVTCRQIMTADPICLENSDTVAAALSVMASGGFRHVPVLEGDVPVRVVDVNDVFRYLSPHLV